MKTLRPISPKMAEPVRRAVFHLARRLRSERSAESLSQNKLSVLSDLHHHGPCTAGELTEFQRQKPQSMTRVFAELESAGLIGRSKSEEDGRQAVLEITAAGRTALMNDIAQCDSWLADQMNNLNETERQVLCLAASIMDSIANT
jgi:DNA-binding MarR family transcriptional regulator